MNSPLGTNDDTKSNWTCSIGTRVRSEFSGPKRALFAVHARHTGQAATASITCNRIPGQLCPSVRMRSYVAITPKWPCSCASRIRSRCCEVTDGAAREKNSNGGETVLWDGWSGCNGSRPFGITRTDGASGENRTTVVGGRGSARTAGKQDGCESESDTSVCDPMRCNAVTERDCKQDGRGCDTAVCAVQGEPPCTPVCNAVVCDVVAVEKCDSLPLPHTCPA